MPPVLHHDHRPGKPVNCPRETALPWHLTITHLSARPQPRPVDRPSTLAGRTLSARPPVPLPGPWLICCAFFLISGLKRTQPVTWRVASAKTANLGSLDARRGTPVRSTPRPE